MGTLQEEVRRKLESRGEPVLLQDNAWKTGGVGGYIGQWGLLTLTPRRLLLSQTYRPFLLPWRSDLFELAEIPLETVKRAVIHRRRWHPVFVLPRGDTLEIVDCEGKVFSFRVGRAEAWREAILDAAEKHSPHTHAP